MSNGQNFKVLGWKKNDNVYTLHVQALKEIEVRFTHILSAPSNGAQTTLDAAGTNGQWANPTKFFLDIMQSAGQTAPAAAKAPIEVTAAPSTGAATPAYVTTETTAQVQAATSTGKRTGRSINAGSCRAGGIRGAVVGPRCSQSGCGSS